VAREAPAGGVVESHDNGADRRVALKRTRPERHEWRELPVASVAVVPAHYEKNVRITR
jgi:hypothetical protein